MGRVLFGLFLLLGGCSEFIDANKPIRSTYYYYSLKTEPSPARQKIPLRLGVYPVSGDAKFQREPILYREAKQPERIGSYVGVSSAHLWIASPIFLVDELAQYYFPERVRQFVSYPDIAAVDYVLHLHLKHFEAFLGEVESKVLVELQYHIFDDNGTLFRAGRVRQEKNYPTDPAELNHMVSSLSTCTQGCLQQIVNKLAEDLELN